MNNISKAPKISVIGAGAWGSALAQSLAFNGHNITLWARRPELANKINETHYNQPYLGDIALSHNITATSDIKAAMESDILFMVTPAQSLRFILADMASYIRPEHVLVLCSKGIEMQSCMLMSEISKSLIPNTPIAVLTGPNFAHDIARLKPAATTLACEDEELARTLQNVVAAPYFRPYISNDIIGAQIAGALKNVIAIACGIAKGLDMGESALASLVTRGLAEISRLGIAMGAKQETFMGMCGVGDLMLTCSSEKSRNFSLGYALGQGQSLDQIMNSRQSVTEGVHTAQSAITLAKKYKVEMPISMAVHKCLNEGLPLDEVLKEMLNRPIGHES